MQFLKHKDHVYPKSSRNKKHWRVMIILPIMAICLVLSNCYSTEKAAEKSEPNSIIAEGAEVTLVSGDFQFTEGPAVDAEGNIYFTDQPNNKIHKWSAKDGKITVFHEKPGRANGLYFDKEGNLYACADEKNQLWKIDMDGNVTVLVKDYEGKLLNGPNDLWISPISGAIYFTDPLYARDYWDRSRQVQQEAGQQVYYLSPDRKTLKCITKDMQQPNGIIGTPDGKTLYVADMRARQTFTFKINDDGLLTDKTPFCSMGSDGMTIDNQGNIYLTGRGVTVFNSKGEQINRINVGRGWTANVCFGGKDRKTLFITSDTSVYTLKMNVKGVK